MKNYAAEGHKKLGPTNKADIEFIKIKEPQAILSLALLGKDMGIKPYWIFQNDFLPDFIISGYRTESKAHATATAFDIKVGNLENQITWINTAVNKRKLFTRGGLYPGQNTCHIDQCNKNWMEVNFGTKFWVQDPETKTYTGFWDLEKAVICAKLCLQKTQ